MRWFTRNAIFLAPPTATFATTLCYCGGRRSPFSKWLRFAGSLFALVDGLTARASRHLVQIPDYLWNFPFKGFRRRTPGPPPFSSMNSTPADSKARLTARSFAVVIDVWSSVSSARRIVATLNDVRRARSSALHRMRERAALICALVSGVESILIISKCF
jgi:hypothetical protein